MTPFDRAIAFVLPHEGSLGQLSEDPTDPGGLTRWGISQRAYPDVDVRHLTREGAIALYRRDYWPQCAGLPWPLALALFDGVVNHGVTRAIGLLQRALHVTADGVIGPATLAALASAPVRDVLAEFLARRALLYVAEPPDEWAVNGHGWMRRLFDVCLEGQP